MADIYEDRNQGAEFATPPLEKSLARYLPPDVLSSIADELAQRSGSELYAAAGRAAELIVANASAAAESLGCELNACTLRKYLSSQLDAADPYWERLVHHLSHSSLLKERRSDYGDDHFHVNDPETVGCFVAGAWEFYDAYDYAGELIEGSKRLGQSFDTGELSANLECLQLVRRLLVETHGRLKRFLNPPSCRLEDIDRCVNLLHHKIELCAIIQDKLPDIEALRAKLPELTATYGAKAANLIVIRDALALLKSRDNAVLGQMEVPPFLAIETDAYDARDLADSLRDTVTGITSWIEGQPGTDQRYIVRSSAQYGEDSDSHIGAGVYESVVLPRNPNTEDVERAVCKVYASAGSEAAITHRRSIGLGCERMGLLIQQMEVDEEDNVALLTVDSVMPNVPELAAVSCRVGLHPAVTGNDLTDSVAVLNRAGAGWEFGNFYYWDSADAPRLHLPVDSQVIGPFETWQAAQAMILMELIFGGLRQNEIAVGTGDSVKILQSRPLPESWLRPMPFDGFPESPPVCNGRSVSVLNGVTARVVEVERLATAEIVKSLLEAVRPHTDEYYLVPLREGLKHSNSAQHIIRYCLDNQVPRSALARIIFVTSATHNEGFHFDTICTTHGFNMVRLPTSQWLPATTEQVRVYSHGGEARIYSNH